MTATAAPATGRKWYQGLPLLSWAPVAFIAALLLLGVYGWARKDSGPSKEDVAATIAAAAREGGTQGGATALQALGIAPATTAPPAAPSPHYDYITCSHQRPDEKPPCKPIVRFPLTEGAKTFIGYEDGGIAGELSTVQTRLVLVQISDLGTAMEPCDLWLGSKVDEGGNFDLTVYPTGDKAPDGAAKLFDCSPSRQGTPGTIPTQGAS